MDAAYLNYVPPPGLSSGGFALDDKGAMRSLAPKDIHEHGIKG